MMMMMMMMMMASTWYIGAAREGCLRTSWLQQWDSCAENAWYDPTLRIIIIIIMIMMTMKIMMIMMVTLVVLIISSGRGVLRTRCIIQP